MIHYELRCDTGHGFDGWFKDSASFDMQSKQGLLSCPTCGSAAVDRALMAPSVAKRRRQEVVQATPAATDTTLPAAPEMAPNMVMDPARLPDHVRAALQKLRSEIEKHCTYVGTGFADEARRIHRGEADPRGIYGESTPEQAELLAEEGIEIARVPWVPRADG